MSTKQVFYNRGSCYLLLTLLENSIPIKQFFLYPKHNDEQITNLQVLSFNIFGFYSRHVYVSLNERN